MAEKPQDVKSGKDVAEPAGKKLDFDDETLKGKK